MLENQCLSYRYLAPYFLFGIYFDLNPQGMKYLDLTVLRLRQQLHLHLYIHRSPRERRTDGAEFCRSHFRNIHSSRSDHENIYECPGF